MLMLCDNVYMCSLQCIQRLELSLSLSLSMDMLTSILGQRLHLNVCVYAKSLSKDWLVARV